MESGTDNQSLADPARLAIIDKLFEYNIGDSVALPQVYSLMGLDSAVEQEKKTFSEDVLKIEIRGPGEQHLSVIDVPGIFKKTTAGLTTKTDMVMVRNMVSNYMKNPRAAILAVIPANVDIATQEILEMAEEHDPNGQRTLGVLTKPDLVDKGAEQNVMDLVEGRSHKLSLGWCILRNLGQRELADSSSNRHALESSFFRTDEPWVNLDKDRVGIEALQARLRDVLTEIVRREFPRVKSDINKRLNSCKQQLEALGPCRETKEQQQKHLLDLATRFQKITSLALDARYGGDDIFQDVGGLKLATSIVDRNEKFSNDVRKRGHTVDFEETPEEFEFDTEDVPSPMSDPENEDNADARHMDDLDNIDGLMLEYYPIPRLSVEKISPWLRHIYTSSRGFELGTFDAALIPLIWKKQSANWNDLALSYISDVIVTVHRFIRKLLQAICPDDRILQGLNSVLLEGLVTRYQKAIDHVKFILHVERAGTPSTLNHYFNDNLEQCRQKRLESSMERKAINITNYGRMVELNAIYQKAHMSNVDHAVRDLHDILKSYYKVARKRFVDVVCMQGADFHLVTGPDTPAKVFSPSFVTGLKPEQLEGIAGETLTTRKKRAELVREISSLEKGKKILI
ncbi:hypothetical protein MMC22_006432 [Lobaria immixta]|nr:hypothetical protein [Lobaria immixta]